MKCIQLGRNHRNVCWVYKNTFQCSCRPGTEEVAKSNQKSESKGTQVMQFLDNNVLRQRRRKWIYIGKKRTASTVTPEGWEVQLPSPLGYQKTDRHQLSRREFPAKVEQGNALPSCLSSHIVNMRPFCSLLHATFFTFCALCWWFCCVKWPKIVHVHCS